MPVAVLALQLGHARRQSDKQVLIETAVLVLCRQGLQDFTQSAQYPAIATAPKHFLAVGFFFIKIAGIAVEEMLFLIEQEIICGPVLTI